MSSYPNAYQPGQPLPGPPPGPPPGPSRSSSHHTHHSGPPTSYNPQYEQPSQPFPSYYPPTSQPHHLAPIPQHRPMPQSQMRSQSYSQPKGIPIPPPMNGGSGDGSYPTAPGYLHPAHSSAPNSAYGPPTSYPFGEPYARPNPDPRRASASSHHSARSTASYNSHRSGGRRSHDHGYSDQGYDSVYYDSEDEERRKRKERRRKRREEKEHKEKERPTLGDSVYALFGGVKEALGSTGKH